MHLVRRELEGYMLPRSVNFGITIQILELQVWTIIVCLIMCIVTCLQDKGLDVVTPKYFYLPVIKIYFAEIV